jgi:hypothetical protein
MDRLEIKKIIYEAFGERIDEGLSNALLMRAKKALISEMYENYGNDIFSIVSKKSSFDITDDDRRGNTNNWKRAVNEWATAQVDKFCGILNQLMDDNEGMLPIWREITLDSNKQPDAHIKINGVFWSWDKEAVINYGNNEWIFHAKVPFKIIDWIPTIVKNCMPENPIKIVKVLPVDFKYSIEKKYGE